MDEDIWITGLKETRPTISIEKQKHISSLSCTYLKITTEPHQKENKTVLAGRKEAWWIWTVILNMTNCNIETGCESKIEYRDGDDLGRHLPSLLLSTPLVHKPNKHGHRYCCFLNSYSYPWTMVSSFNYTKSLRLPGRSELFEIKEEML